MDMEILIRNAKIKSLTLQGELVIEDVIYLIKEKVQRTYLIIHINERYFSKEEILNLLQVAKSTYRHKIEIVIHWLIYILISYP